MAVSLLLAPAASGKTAHALDRIRAVRAAPAPAGARLAPIIVVLPNTWQRGAFRRRLAAAGGAFGVSLFTFYDLYAELLARAGRPLPVLDDAAQVRVLRALIDALAERRELEYFAPLRAKPGFPAVLREAFEELKRARVYQDDLVRAAQPLGPRLGELAALYTAYQRWLQEHGWADPEGEGWLAAVALEQDSRLGGDTRLLVVDGFDEFNSTQLAVLQHLARRARETLITLTGECDRRRLAHRRFLRAQDQLIAALQPDLVWLDGDAPRKPGALDRLETHLFEPPAVPPLLHPSLAPRPPVTFLEAQTRSLEARAALRWIKERLVLDGVPAAETAVLARSLEVYRPFLEEVAREFGLPLRLAGGAPLAENPLIGALLDALALPAAGAWRPRLVLAALRSPYFDWAALGCADRHIAALDAVARLGRVVEGLAHWREAFEARLHARPAEADDEPEAGGLAVSPAAAREAQAAFQTLVARLTPPAAATWREYAAFVEGLIGDEAASDSLNVVARARAAPETAARDLAALRAFKDALRALRLSQSLIADSSSPSEALIDYPAFLHALRESLQSPVSNLSSADGIFTASVLDARGLSFRAVAVLGLAEGEFPAAEREMPLLREADRAELRARGIRLDPRLRGDEVTVFYHAVTRARERLLLCRPYLADDGQPWEPSAYWREAHRLCGEPPAARVRAGDPLPPEQIASEAEWIDHGQAPPAVARGLAVLRARLAEAAAGPYEGELPELAPALAARFPPDRSWSPSRLEAYGACGFYFYFAHALELEPRAEPEAGYDVRALGSLYHAILERLYRDAPDPTDLDALLERLPGLAADVFASAPRAYGFRPTALWGQQQAELLRILEATVTALAEMSPGWTPRHFEQRFGFGTPPLTVPTGAGEARIHGYIDRVDVDAAGRLRVIDYKASGAPIRPDDLRAGRRLQLPLYALAARDALGLGEVAGGFYWHIGRAEPSALKLETYDGGVAGAFTAARQHLAAHIAGIRAGRFQPRPPDGGCPAYCPAVAFCWRYQPRSY